MMTTATVPTAPPQPATPAPADPPSRRLVSLDTYRGLVMFLLAAVTVRHDWQRELAQGFPGSTFFGWVEYQFSHLAWSTAGITVWDMIQPSFMFMVGLSMAYSYAKRRSMDHSYNMMLAHAVYRAMLLILLGVFLRSGGHEQTYWTFEDVITQIGLGYVFLFLLWDRPRWVQATAAGGILVGYWLLFVVWPLPGPGYDWAAVGVSGEWLQQHGYEGFAAHWDKNANPAHYFDQWFLNLFPREQPFVANGGGYNTLNFIPSLATMIFGLMAGEHLRRKDRGQRSKAAWLAVLGAAAIGLGLLLHFTGICPIVKRIWSPSFAIYSGGFCLLVLSLLFVVIDGMGFRRWAFPLVVLGMNPITIYIMTWLIGHWIYDRLELHLGESVFTVFGEPFTPLMQNMAVLLVLWLIGFWMYKRKIFLRI